MTGNVSAIAPNPAPTRYHPALVVQHWLIAALIVATALLALFPGREGEGFRAGGLGITGLPLLSIHMILGILVLVLLIGRLVIRWRRPRPGWATTGSGFLDGLGVATHWALYSFTFAIAITGLVLALQMNRLARVFTAAGANPALTSSQGGGPAPSGGFRPGQLPPSGSFRGGDRTGGFAEGRFSRQGGFFSGAFHGLSWTILLLLIILHVGATAYHQFLRRDGLLGRVWFGRRYA